MSQDFSNDQFQFSYLNKYWLVFGLVFLLLGIFFFLFANLFSNDDWFVHGIFCILSTFFICVQSCLIFKIPKIIIILDLRWILMMSFWLYYTFGASMLYFGSDKQIELAMDYYYVDLNLALKANSINSIGFSLMIILISLFNIHWPAKILNTLHKNFIFFSRSDFILFILLFLSLFSLILDHLNLSGIITITSFYGPILFFKDIGLSYLLILIYYKGPNKKFISFFVLLHFVLYVYGGLIFLNKAAIFLPIIIFSICFILKRKFMKFTIIFVIMVLSLTISQDYVSELRSTKNYNYQFKADIFKKNILTNENKSSASLWDRLNYLNTQGAVINFYDNNDKAENLKLSLWLFIPRIIFEQKPNINLFSKNLYRKITGHGGSSDTPGIFIEGYYNYGWFGLFLTSFLAASIIMIYKTMIYHIVQKKIFPLYFVITAALYTCFRIDGLILNDYLGRFIYVIVFMIIMIFISQLAKLIFDKNK
jgi:hypothetical protein